MAYVYRPIPIGNIRILELQPGESSSPLHAALVFHRICNEHFVNTQVHAGPGAVWTAHLDAVWKPFESNHLILEQSTSNGFEALSYVWGAQTFSHSITIDATSMIHITESLFTALQRLRHRDKVRRIWADAICINQSDMTERSSQVSLMAIIYNLADKVLVWLGDCAVEGSETFAFAALGAGLQSDHRRPDRPELRMTDPEILKLIENHLEARRWCGCCGHPLDHPSFSGMEALVEISRLLKRPWFTRVWVVQEVALAKEVHVHCGSHHATWTSLKDAIENLWSMRLSGGDFDNDAYSSELSQGWLQYAWEQFVSLEKFRREASSSFSSQRFLRGIAKISLRHCQEPHDRVFGVRRILGLDREAGLLPDYRTSAAEIFRRVMVVCLRSTSTFSVMDQACLLAIAGTMTKSTMEKLSWVPDFHRLSNGSRAKESCYDHKFGEGQFKCASDAFACQFSSEQPYSEDLNLRGMQFAKVGEILHDSRCPVPYPEEHEGSGACSDREGVALVDWYCRCRSFLMQNGQLTPFHPEFHQLLSTTQDLKGEDQEIHTILCCDDVQDLPRSAMVSVEVFNGWAAATGRDMMKSAEDIDRCRTILRPFISGTPHPRYDRERNLCFVDSTVGRLAAWVPQAAEKGDSLLYICGAPYPFVIRDNGDETFQLLGDAYVHGIEEVQILGVPETERAELSAAMSYRSAERQRYNDAVRQWNLSDADDRKQRRGKALEMRQKAVEKLQLLNDKHTQMIVDASKACPFATLR